MKVFSETDLCLISPQVDSPGMDKMSSCAAALTTKPNQTSAATQIPSVAETVDPTGRLGIRLPTGELAFVSEGDVTLAG